MTYIIDLQRLWEERKTISSSQLQVAPGAYVDPRQCVISAIVIAQGDTLSLIQSLSALCAQVLCREVVVVDTQSSPALTTALKQFSKTYPKCILVHGQPKIGVANAYNLGARYSSGQYLLLLDPHVILSAPSLLKLLATGLRKPHPWIVGLKTQDGNPVLPEVTMVGGGIHTGSVTADCLFLPSADFFSVKGFDAQCQHSAFHLDLCMRFHLAGGGVYKANEVDYTMLERSPQPLMKQLVLQWQACRGKWHYYQKFYSHKANIGCLTMTRNLTKKLLLALRRFSGW